MNLLEAYREWVSLKKTHDIKKVNVTHSGAFYMKSSDLFDKKSEVEEYVQKLNESLEKFKAKTSQK